MLLLLLLSLPPVPSDVDAAFRPRPAPVAAAAAVTVAAAAHRVVGQDGAEGVADEDDLAEETAALLGGKEISVDLKMKDLRLRYDSKKEITRRSLQIILKSFQIIHAQFSFCSLFRFVLADPSLFRQCSPG